MNPKRKRDVREACELQTISYVLHHVWPVSRPTLHRAIKAGVFPPPIEINGRNYWLKAELSDWVAARTASRVAKQDAVAA